jgi:hypothetical protein
MKPFRLLPILIVAVLLLSAPLARAATAIPATLSYQGSMYNTDGTPFSGVKNMIFSLYSVATGGLSFWSETQTAVNIANGRFATVLGVTTALVPANFTADVWLGVQVVGDPSEMTPRQKLTSSAYAFNAGNGVPVGGIIMWSGPIATIPAGWALCNGQTVNGKVTPDLRSRFVVGADTTGTYTTGARGGEATHTLTLAEMPSHNHQVANYKMLLYNGSATTWTTDWTATEPNLVDQGSYPAFEGGGQAHNNLPPYYALAYIMRLE